MVAFRDGNFSVPVPRDCSGMNGRIAKARNMPIGHKAQITTEARGLSSLVGKEPKIKRCMSLPGAIGEWARKLEAINSLIDGLVRPTPNVARTIGAMARGDLGQSMEVDSRLGGRANITGAARM